jgi:hypothetical protein
MIDCRMKRTNTWTGKQTADCHSGWTDRDVARHIAIQPRAGLTHGLADRLAIRCDVQTVVSPNAETGGQLAGYPCRQTCRHADKQPDGCANILTDRHTAIQNNNNSNFKFKDK